MSSFVTGSDAPADGHERRRIMAGQLKKRADPQVRPYSLRAPSPYFEIIFRLSAEIIILPS